MNTVGERGSAQPLAKDTTPYAVPLKTAGPPESPCNKIRNYNGIYSVIGSMRNVGLKVDCQNNDSFRC